MSSLPIFLRTSRAVRNPIASSGYPRYYSHKYARLHKLLDPSLASRNVDDMPPKRKRSAAAAPAVDRPLNGVHETPILPNSAINPPPLKKRASRRGKVDTNPDHNADIVDGKFALRASPDADEKGEAFDAASLRPITPVPLPLPVAKTNGVVKKEADIEGLNGVEAPSKKQKKSPTKSSIAAKKGTDEIKAFRAEQAAKKAAEAKVKKEEDVDEWDKRLDPDGDEEGPAEAVDAVQAAAKRSPPVHSDYLPLPWKGRLGYACLNTYLRSSNPPIFTSRTCRIASILEHRHPLKDPSQPEHATKNRSDKSQPASVERGQRYVEELCLANIRDIPKMLLWNDKYGIKFMRLSSEMFPFASHAEYGYKLAPFASEALAEAGRVAGELGHRLSTHPGQFTQLGSPRAEVIANAVRDLEYHNEMLSLLKLPEQANRDAVMILHLGGTFGDKAATLDRFRQNYSALSPPIKARIVLENDDVSWSVHDLLPLCEELNIPLCLDFHHHNIIFDTSQLREGTQDITTIFPRIKATWTRKGITQKMHYSEPCPEAITGTQRRKHNPRPAMLPPCPNDMDLMIEAKDKEQAVFDLMRHYKLPGWDTFNDVVPYERDDDNRPAPKKAKGKKKTKKQIESEIEEFGEEIKEVEDELAPIIPEEEIGMGGKENRVYWPLGMEEWLRPKKREIAGKKKGAGGDEEEMFQNPTPANFKARQEITKRNRKPLASEELEKMREAKNVEDIKRLLNEIKEKEAGVVDEDVAKEPSASKTKNGKGITTPSMKATPKPKATPKARKAKSAPTPSVSNMEDEEDEDEELSLPEISEEEDYDEKPVLKRAVSSRQSGRAKAKPMSYAEDHDDEEI